MKRIILSSIILVLALSMFGQSPLRKGNNQINAGVGIDTWGVPVYVGIDHAVHDDVTIGGELHAQFYRYDHDGYYDYRGNYHRSYGYHEERTGVAIGLSGNGNYHFNTLLEMPDNFDLYAGLNLGFYVGGHGTTGLGLGIQVGGRYYFNDNIGINLELGGGSKFSGAKFGLSFRL